MLSICVFVYTLPRPELIVEIVFDKSNTVLSIADLFPLTVVDKSNTVLSIADLFPPTVVDNAVTFPSTVEMSSVAFFPAVIP